ncbi:hypothetical protein [Flavobacterium limnophilum]|uniref:hypothetical protein n=1 Tax=Flavobacterium limnophilum TaxID=3003262 RepID=UPI0022ABE789|nr:hypothetical protein [Flavobacterium limnophilum]
MKKILGILGVTVMAVTMFLSTNNTNGASSDVNLAGLFTFNSANAQTECDVKPNCATSDNVCYIDKFKNNHYGNKTELC